MDKVVAENAGNTYGSHRSPQVLVYGGTAPGIAAALAAARQGCKTLLIERGDHWGAMMSSGLGAIDLLRKNASGGIFAELLSRVKDYYFSMYGENSEEYRLSYECLFMEPHVAELVLNQMIAEQAGLETLTRHELVGAIKHEDQLLGSTYRNRDTGELLRVDHTVAIDTTYEGDLAAAAGVRYRIGREGRDEYGERLAGRIFFDYRHNRQNLLPESTGEASPYFQSYCFRTTLSDDAKTRVPFERPDSYADLLPYYLPLLDDLTNGRVRMMREVMWINPLPNRKWCSNGHLEALTSMNVAEVNLNWPDGDWTTRDALFKFYRDYTIGLWHFMQTDRRIDLVKRTETGCYGLAADEYINDGNFPWQLYVRQGRRIIGEYMLTEHNCIPEPGKIRPAIHRDSIAICEHSFDAHPCRNRGGDGIAHADDGYELLEGVIFFRNKLKPVNRPATIPYRSIVPERVNGLLVPVALSASHIAFTTLRMEGIWMATSQAAGVAAAQAIATDNQVRAIDTDQLQKTLAGQGQVMVYFDNLMLDDPEFGELQLRALVEDIPDFDVSHLRERRSTHA